MPRKYYYIEQRLSAARTLLDEHLIRMTESLTETQKEMMRQYAITVMNVLDGFTSLEDAIKNVDSILTAEEAPGAGPYKLPYEVKCLVNDGVYSLYEVESEHMKYVLMTNHNEFYQLDETGKILGTVIKGLEGLKLIRAIRFEDLERPPGLKVYYP